MVGFELDGDDILIGSYQNLAGSRKYKNVAAGGDKVSLIVDSLASVDPMDPVAVKIHGTASIEQRNGRFGPMEYIVVRPRIRGAGESRGRPSSTGSFSRTNRLGHDNRMAPH